MMKKMMIWLVLMILCAMPLTGALADERGYDTPEACAQALFAALRAQDTEAMEECIAFDEMAASFDFAAQAERLNAVVGNMSFLPPNSPFAIEHNRGWLERTWYLRLTALGLREKDSTLAALFSGRTIVKDSEEYNAILSAVDRDGAFNIFPELVYQDTIPPSAIPSIADLYASDANQNVLRKTMEIWRVKNYTELAIRFTTTVETRYTEGAQYVIPLRFVQFGGRWLVDPNGSTLAVLLNMSSYDFVAALP